MRSSVEIYDMTTRECEVVWETEDLVEAPNWSPDGTRLLFDSARGGRYQVHRPPVDSMRQYADWSDSLVLEQDPVKGLIDRQALFLDRWLQALNTHLGKGALYAMPWYLVLGLPGSGKSSLIHRANPANKLNPRLDTELRGVDQ